MRKKYVFYCIKILLELPVRLHGLDWYRIFSTDTHGFSLNQLYRQSLQLDHDLPSLLIVKDIEQNVKKPNLFEKIIVLK